MAGSSQSRASELIPEQTNVGAWLPNRQCQSFRFLSGRSQRAVLALSHRCQPGLNVAAVVYFRRSAYRAVHFAALHDRDNSIGTNCYNCYKAGVIRVVRARGAGISRNSSKSLLRAGCFASTLFVPRFPTINGKDITRQARSGEPSPEDHGPAIAACKQNLNISYGIWKVDPRFYIGSDGNGQCAGNVGERGR